MIKYYTGWIVENVQELLQHFPIKYPKIPKFHVTREYDICPDCYDSAPQVHRACVIGFTDNNDGIQALIVRVNGTMFRPDGRIYYCAWSLGRERKEVEADSVIRELGWKSYFPPVDIVLRPELFKSNN